MQNEEQKQQQQTKAIINENQALVALEIEYIKLFLQDKATKTLQLIQEGVLEIAHFQWKEDVYFIKINDFIYTFYKELPVYVTAYQNQRSYIFPKEESTGFYILVISNDLEIYFQVLDKIISENAKLIYNEEIKSENAQQQNSQQQNSQQQNSQQQNSQQQQQQKNKSSQQLKQPEQKNHIVTFYDNYSEVDSKNSDQKPETQKVIFEQKEKQQLQQQQNEKDKEEDKDDDNKVVQVIKYTGNALSSGISFASNIFSKSIKATGDFISSNISKKEEIIISEETKKKQSELKIQSQKIIQFTANAAKIIIETNLELGRMAGHAIAEMIKSENKQEEQEQELSSPKFKYLSQIGSNSLAASLQIIQSLDQAAIQIGDQLGDTIKNVVHKKYGEDTANMVSDGLQTAFEASKALSSVNQLKPAKIIKNVAKETAKQAGKDLI